MNQQIILASGSPARRALLGATGLKFDVVPAELDEEAASAPLEESNAEPADIAAALALVKALSVSERHPGALVIAADQTLECEGQLFRKAADMAEARRQLLRLSGKTHFLHAAIACAENGQIIYETQESAAITLRHLAPEEVGRYFAFVGEQILSSVGLYHLEGPGIRLMERIEGDYFTILGMPMLPLLSFLRGRGIGTF
ncbi:Maf family protein [Afifella sp. IM 167]|uniref:Maf family protein n=1 Tax=Afifella sp. IM 167 TaxID=2033586 RepID=UPI001CCB78BB|nr:Maf family protein [Afifella sp. IM 167]MBZ8133530.1 septum formation inhibitor Maf [Afifella sp. IM 167]